MVVSPDLLLKAFEHVCVELARGEVGELVPEDFFEKTVRGFVQESRQADEAALGIAAIEAIRP